MDKQKVRKKIEVLEQNNFNIEFDTNAFSANGGSGGTTMCSISYNIADGVKVFRSRVDEATAEFVFNRVFENFNSIIKICEKTRGSVLFDDLYYQKSNLQLNLSRGKVYIGFSTKFTEGVSKVLECYDTDILVWINNMVERHLLEVFREETIAERWNGEKYNNTILVDSVKVKGSFYLLIILKLKPVHILVYKDGMEANIFDEDFSLVLKKLELLKNF